MLEKRRKIKRKGKRGRQKGTKNPKKEIETHVFWMDKKVGRISPLGDASLEIAMSATTIYQQFKGKHITTNLIEKEFSALKKVLGERGNRSVKRWESLLTGYFTIRDDPRILKKVVKDIKLPSQWGKIGMRQILEISISDL